jgi:hypothetical protein
LIAPGLAYELFSVEVGAGVFFDLDESVEELEAPESPSDFFGEFPPELPPFA